MAQKQISWRYRFTPRRKRMLLVVGSGILVLAACVAVRLTKGTPPASATPPANAQNAAPPAGRRPAAATNDQPSSVVAVVNGHRITREQLGRECLRHYGKEVLETVMHRYLIALECRKHNVSITKEDVDQEIDKIARRFGLPVDQWLMLLQSERQIAPDSYRQEIVWPTLALRRLAATELQVAEAEIQKELESQFGSKVKVRMIVLEDPQKARQVHAAASANPDDFSRLAVKHSKDVNSASAGGLVQPIRRHVGDPVIEKAAFALRPGQISNVLPLGNHHVILKCEAQIPGTKPGDAQLKQARLIITESIRDRKLRAVGSEIFKRLQKDAHVENILNDPAKRRQMPGIAATINGHKITIAELEKACLKRHGDEVLEGTINRALLEMELEKAGRQVTRSDIDKEIARAAVSAGIVLRDGKADIPRWTKMITDEQKISREAYQANTVWPTVALKKLVGKVEIETEDLQKSFEANYGPRVRCRAIIMSNLRRAQEVWDMARRKPTIDNFAELAAEYSIDGGSRSLGGVVPPIQRHGGQPALEREAFNLQAGELSGVIQIGDKYVILLCEEVTKPVVVEMSEVRDLLQEDLLEKKMRIAMAQNFERLVEKARIINYLDPDSSHSPKPTARRERPGTAAARTRG